MSGESAITSEETLRLLGTALQARGLRVRMQPESARIVAVNPRTGGDTRDPRYPAQPMHQAVKCAPDSETGELWLWWVWAGPQRGLTELEPMLPARETSLAADKIAHVVAADGDVPPLTQ